MAAQIILNEHSCRGREACAAIKGTADRAGVTIKISQYRGDVATLTGRAIAEGIDRVIIAGGDGTINEALNGLLETVADPDDWPELAILPCGTANDFARSVGMGSGANWESMLKIAIEAEALPCDVLKVEAKNAAPRFALNACSGGFAREVSAHMTDDHKQLLGPLSYWITGARELFHLKPYGLELEIDGAGAHIEAYQVVIANGRFIGGGFLASPDALLNDGKLDLIIAPVQSSLEMLLSLTAAQFGLHADSENIVTRRAERVRIRTEPPMGWSADGENIDVTPAITVSTHPGAVKVAAPSDSDALARQPNHRETTA